MSSGARGSKSSGASVMDIGYAAGRITYDHADALIKEILERDLTVD